MDPIITLNPTATVLAQPGPSRISLRDLMKQRFFDRMGYGGGPQYSQEEIEASQPESLAGLLQAKQTKNATPTHKSLKKKAFHKGFGY